MIGAWQLGIRSTASKPSTSGSLRQANLAEIPDDLSDEQCVLLADIASTGSLRPSGRTSESARRSPSLPRPDRLCARPARG